MGRQKQFDEDACLTYQPFGGDETDTTVLSDKIVKAAKDHPHCQMCSGPIFKGERHRAMRERNNEERKIETWRWCSKCCRAQAMAEDYGRFEFAECDRAVISRIRIGDARQEAARRPTAHPTEAQP
ncbi:hypothetical protein [Roseomonas xinghualingensis]|uniref:hypothetical protein n=1 Tax=Roseomonas xinghualingensis TaxID=2986475 RepID=UPI0021F1CABC|nr:hypothetical protein [Roseomonas sp. SXEYE001]MCV4207533.1 hypothetical protein [Roseomonas sp. SXEYE001]